MIRKTHRFLIVGIVVVVIALVWGNTGCNHGENDVGRLISDSKSMLSSLGGIGAFETPYEVVPLSQYEPGNLRTQQKKQTLDKIINKLEEAIKLSPSTGDAYHYLGITYILKNDTNKAIEAFSKSIDVGGDIETSYIYLANILISQKDYGKARVVADKYISLYPKSVIEGLILKGTSYYRQSDYENSIKIGKKIVHENYNSVFGHILLANSYYKLGSEGKAGREYEIVIKLEPKMRDEIEMIKKGVMEK